EGDVEIWDAESQSKIRTMSGHQARVGVMSWERHILSSGCRDGSIWNHDVRIANHKTAELVAHDHEVCGLTWRADGALLASGGNDNRVNIWDARSTVPKFTKMQHTAAVTSIQWSNEYRELVTSHGFPHNHLALWSYPSLAKIVDIPAHDTRVLHTAMSPDGQTIATAASDESLKFWRIFESRTKTGRAGKAGTSSAMPQAAAAAGGSAAAAAASALDVSRPTYIR
ncbi:WD repeat-containing protein slp1, partial [Coemansia sp. RSA 2702]